MMSVLEQCPLLTTEDQPGRQQVVDRRPLSVQTEEVVGDIVHDHVFEGTERWGSTRSAAVGSMYVDFVLGLFLLMGMRDIVGEWSKLEECVVPLHMWTLFSYVQIVVFRALSYSPHSQASVGAASALPAPSTSSGGFLSLIHVYPSNSVPHVVQKITSWVLLPTFALWTLLGAYWIAEVSLSDKMCAGVGGHQELGSTSSTSGVGGGLTQSGAGQINSTTSSKVVGSLDHPPRTTEVSGQQQSGNDQLRAAVENMIPHRFFPPGLDGIPPYFFPVWVLFCMLWTLVHIALVGLWQLNLRAVSEGADPIIGCDFSREMIFVSSRRVDEMNTRSSRRGRRVCRSSRRRGLSRAQIASMPTRIATPQDVFVGAGKDHPGSGRTTIAEFFKGETECSICLQAFEAGEILKFPCARCRCCFHEACIDAWYLQRNSCPHCRKKHRRWPEV